MISKAKFVQLHEKLKNNSISKSEYDEFLAFVNTNRHTDFVKEILDDDFEGYEITYAKKSKLKPLVFWSRIAAAILFISASIYFLNLYKSSSEEDNASQILSYSTKDLPSETFLLPDSSSVKLNSYSKITWVNKQNGERLVKLNGEAFFNVVHTSDNRSFTVETDRSRIRVLGTSFNVNSREQQDKIFLEEGRIELEMSKNKSQKVTLMPGEGVQIENSTKKLIALKSSKLKNESIWKDGLLRFSGISVLEIIARLEEIYKVKIQIKDKEILTKELELTVPYNNWELTSAALALALGLNEIETADQ